MKKSIQGPIVLLIVLLFASALTLSACAKKDAFSDDMFVAETTPERASAAETPVPSEAPSETPSASMAPTTAPAETTIAATGAEPNPSSSFAQLSSDEQNQLTQWLESVLNAYSGMADAFGTFSGKQSDFVKGLRDGQTASAIPAYQELEAACRIELDKLDQLSAETLPDAAGGLKNSAQEVAAWYRGFFEELSQKNGTDMEGLRQWLDQQTSSAADSIQKFLDQIRDFRS